MKISPVCCPPWSTLLAFAIIYIQVKAPAAAKIVFCTALATLVLLASFGSHAKGTAKGTIPATNRLGSIVFTSIKADCPGGSMKRPCYVNRDIWVVNSDGSGATPLTTFSTKSVACFEPVWSPDGSKIAFTSNRALDGSDALATNGMTHIWLMNADGSGPTPLAALDGTASGPAWSPDGSKIAFSSARALDGSNAQVGNGNIWVMNSDGSDPIPLTKLPRSVRFISSSGVIWSPDGHKLAFVSDRALDGSNRLETSNIWVINADGSGLMPLTKLTAVNTFVSNPVWSPDNRRLAFSWNRALDNAGAVKPVSARNTWVVNVDGSGARPLTKLTAELASASASDPDWSPDGSKLAFVWKDNIWVMNADGSGAKPLTKFIAKFRPAALNPVWSGDGTKIAFEYTSPVDTAGVNHSINVANIWVMNADGTDATPVTRLGMVTGRLAWRPVH
jgi:Tol biopolymer transport system component